MALSLPLDDKLTQQINRRRITEEMRKRRIFNAKERQIGVDVEALNHQMHDRILSRNREDEINKQFADQIMRQDRLAQLFKEREEDEMREIKKKIDDFRLSQQRPENRRDFDLYDPDQLKKELPPRISDDQPCSVSGLQKLEGEDLDHKARSQKQKEQVRDLLLQQMQEKRMKKFLDQKQINEWESILLNQDSKALQLSEAELQERRKNLEDLINANRQLASEYTERKIQQQKQDEYEKIKDIKNNFYGDLLSENPLVARSAFGPHRVVPDRWKGMSKQQLEEYYDGQIRQIMDKKLEKDRENYDAAKWNEIISNQDTKAKLQAKEEEHQKAEQNKRQALENLYLSQEQKLKQNYINKVVYSNVPTEEFFSQFNTSTR